MMAISAVVYIPTVIHPIHRDMGLSVWDVHKPFPCFDSWISTQEDGSAMVKFHCLSFVSPIQEGESSCGLDDHSSNTM